MILNNNVKKQTLSIAVKYYHMYQWRARDHVDEITEMKWKWNGHALRCHFYYNAVSPWPWCIISCLRKAMAASPQCWLSISPSYLVESRLARLGAQLTNIFEGVVHFCGCQRVTISRSLASPLVFMIVSGSMLCRWFIFKAACTKASPETRLPFRHWESTPRSFLNGGQRRFLAGALETSSFHFLMYHWPM